MSRRRKEEQDRAMASGKIHKPQQRNAANARERTRMRVLSKAFTRLKTTLPWVPPDTKLSKLDTLRLASSYIVHLRQILDHEETMQAAGYVHPLNLTWPFTFSGRNGSSSQGKADTGSRGGTASSTSGDSCYLTDRDSPQPDPTLSTSCLIAPHL